MHVNCIRSRSRGERYVGIRPCGRALRLIDYRMLHLELRTGPFMYLEQRKHKRFKSKGEAFAAFIKPNQSIIVGRIADISLGGLGIVYLAIDEVGEGTPEVEVFGLDSVHLSRMKSTVVYDTYLPDQSSDFLAVRRCGVQFDQLDRDLESELRGYIEKHCAEADEKERVFADNLAHSKDIEQA